MDEEVEKSKETSKDDAFMDIKSQADEYLEMTTYGRALSERCRDYVDGNQWTDSEKAILAKRNQAAIVNNRIKTKQQGLLGLVAARRTDPKAFPRTQHETKSAEAVTDALRYVADKNDLNTIKQEVADNFFCEGVGVCIVDVKANVKGENDILIEDIHWDRFYYDPYSRKRDFSDARYMGTMTWMDEDQLLSLFPDADIDEMLAGTSTYETFEDRPRWVDKREKRRRFRVAMHFYLKKETWWMCIFTEGGFLAEPLESPYLDDEGEPTCPIEAVGAYIDRQNQRYGELASSLDLQDEINHRRSKALHLLSQRQTKARRGAVKDVAALKRELAKPDGHVEIEGDVKDFDVLQTSDMAQGQFELLQEAKAEIDAQSYNAQMSGDRQNGDLSGKAIQRLQEAGVNELNNLFSALNAWEIRVYRQIWARIKQFWTEEKWIRVTDDQDSLRWVGLNTQVTAQQFLEDTINDTDQPAIKRKQAAAVYQMLMQGAHGNNPQEAMAAQAQLDHPVGIQNRVPELDVDIILDQSFDVINVQQEQFDLLAQMSQNPQSGIDPIELIRVSQIRGKDEMIDRIEKSRAAAQQSSGNAQQLQAQGLQAKNAQAMSQVALNQANVEQTQVETHLMMKYPPQKVQMSESA